MADRIVVMRNGAIEQVAAPEDLFRNPNSAWVCDFVGAGNLVRGALAPAAPGTLRVDAGLGVAIAVRQNRGDPAGTVVQVPFNKLRLEACTDAGHPRVVGRRFLGSTLEVQVAAAQGILSAHMSLDEAMRFDIGAPVRVSADADDCRLLPDR